MKFDRGLRKLHVFLAAAALALMPMATLGSDTPVRIVYWTSGNSLGLGALLEQGGFLEREGLAPEFQKVADVNAPARAVISGSADIAFSASATGAMSMAADGIPVRAFMASNVAEAMFIVRPDSPIQSLAEVAGKRFGVSRVGSAAHSLAVGILQENYGIGTDQFTHLAGNDSQLLQFLQTGEADLIAVRFLSLAGVPEDSYRVISSLDQEWTSLTGRSVPPILGVSITVEDYARANPEVLTAFIRAARAALEFGVREPEAVAAILMDAANMPAGAAANYAAQWGAIYRADLSAETQETLDAMSAMFLKTGVLQKAAPDALYLPQAYEASLAD